MKTNKQSLTALEKLNKAYYIYHNPIKERDEFTEKEFVDIVNNTYCLNFCKDINNPNSSNYVEYDYGLTLTLETYGEKVYQYVIFITDIDCASGEYVKAGPATEEELLYMETVWIKYKRDGSIHLFQVNEYNPPSEGYKRNHWIFNPNTKCWENWK